MKSEEEKILQMLEEGTISAEDAQTLLDAVEELDGNDGSSYSYREIDRNNSIRDAWRRPFGFSMVFATFWGSLALRTRRSTGIVSLIRKLIFFPLTFISALAAAFIYLSKDGPWLYVRIRSAEDEKITISLPFPSNILRGGLQLIKSQTGDEVAGEKIDAATEFLETIEIADYKNPVTIEMEEEGRNIQIFLG